MAHSGLADCCSYLYLYWEPTVDNLRTADSASRRAIALSPGLAEAQASRAMALSTLRNYPEAERAFRIAIEIDPGLFDAHYFYGRACLAQGKFREAIVPLRSACTLRPEDYQAPAMLALAYTGLGRRKLAARAYERTVEVAKQQLAVNPGEVRALYLGAGSLARLGRRKLPWPGRHELSNWTATIPQCCTTSASSMRFSGGRRMPQVLEKSGALGMAQGMDQA